MNDSDEYLLCFSPPKPDAPSIVVSTQFTSASGTVSSVVLPALLKTCAQSKVSQDATSMDRW